METWWTNQDWTNAYVCGPFSMDSGWDPGFDIRNTVIGEWRTFFSWNVIEGWDRNCLVSWEGALHTLTQGESW